MITTVFFDFDDTLAIGPEEGYVPKRVLELGVTSEQLKLMLDFDKRELNNYFLFHQSKDVRTSKDEYVKQKVFYTNMVEEAKIEDKENIIDFMLDYRLQKIKFTLYSEVENIIMDLKDSYNLYFLTNALPSRAREIEQTSIYKYFKGTFVSNIVGLGKPDIKFYQYALDKANVIAENVLFIDDKEEFLLPAKNLGMKVVLIDRKGEYSDSTYLKISSLNELENVINHNFV